MHRSTTIAFVGALALASALTSAPALAVDFMTTRDYYSDATYTVVVGMSGNDCAGNQFAFGQVTEFVITTREPCG